MENFKNVFYGWVTNKVDYQVNCIDKICNDLDISANEWFSKYLNRNAKDYSGADFLSEMLSDFIWHISREFQKPLLKYIEPEGYNIFKEPYLAITLNLKYDLNDGFSIKKKNKKKFVKFCSVLTVTQKQDLMTNKLFSHIINQTNLNFFSKKELRALKIKKINEYHKTIE